MDLSEIGFLMTKREIVDWRIRIDQACGFAVFKLSSCSLHSYKKTLFCKAMKSVCADFDKSAQQNTTFLSSFPVQLASVNQD